MSEEMRLPDDLAACEARLAAHPLGTSLINRDELMYRAGWAAAEAEWSRKTAGVVPNASVTGRVASWSLASAALAASLAVAITLSATRSAREPQTADGQAPSPAPLTIATHQHKVGPAKNPAAQVVADSWLARLEALLVGRTTALRPAPATSLFALASRQRRGHGEELIPASTDVDSAAPVSFVTARQLFDEYLPQPTETAAPGDDSSHGILRLLRPLTGSEDTI